MKRRQVTQLALASVLPASVLPASVWARDPLTPRIRTVAQARAWLDALETSPKARTVEGWPLAHVLAHVAQSVNFSLDGFPQPRSALFQHTAGASAFAFFKWRGQMSHGLTEPIPGAPELPSQTLATSVAGLRSALIRFEAHQGELRPHFAYGALSKPDHALAHALHLDNHLDWVRML